MAVVDTITIGADDFSVYALALTEAVANTTTFFNGRLGPEATAWAAASSDDRLKAVAGAADWLDRGTNPSGTKTVAGQPRKWPRDGASCNAVAVADGTTPDDIFKAQAWLSGAILVDNAAAASAGTGSNVKSAAAGSAKVEFFTPTIGQAQDHRLPQVAHDYVKCYTGASSIAVAEGTGDDCDSAFDEADYQRSEGFA
jgi:hypothetical protein